MNHTAGLDSTVLANGKSLRQRATGKFYTAPFVARRLARETVAALAVRSRLRVLDPFAGDGRLLVAFLREFASAGLQEGAKVELVAWDIDSDGLVAAARNVQRAIHDLQLEVTLESRCWDSLLCGRLHFGSFDVVITNPPWEAIKPDVREFATMRREEQSVYRDELRRYDLQLAEKLPHSQPTRKFSGWGTNLSRCGWELAVGLTGEDGVCGIVLPHSVLADQTTPRLRQWVLGQARCEVIDYYPAEARLFEAVDQPFIAMLLRRRPGGGLACTVNSFDSQCRLQGSRLLSLSADTLSDLDYVIPIEHGSDFVNAWLTWKALGTVADLESSDPDGLWLGRELDETRHEGYLRDSGAHLFVKGRMVGRYRLVEEPSAFVDPELRVIPSSAQHARIAWRDVSRRTQVRRMQAAVLPPGVVAGNSLHVGYFRDDDVDRLFALAAVMNSIPFEFQVRSRLSTGHISLGVVRQIRIPTLRDRSLVESLSLAARAAGTGRPVEEANAEVLVAKAYGLEREDFLRLLAHFPGLSEDFVAAVSSPAVWSSDISRAMRADGKGKPSVATGPIRGIPNHFSAKLSALDLDVARAVPPGGNWKDIPETVESARVHRIRKSYAAGEGSRSTYYGRLLGSAPAYTINTYFNRPGNGCHLHYDFAGGQHRVLSQREAARLQSFPDAFVFHGNRGSVNKQIGNAVPPLLAYHVARAFPFRGSFVDLFAGAGGLALGFMWAGWKPIAGNDVDPWFLRTYSQNVQDSAICGDIREPSIFSAMVDLAKARAGRNPELPVLLLGGPPCQGFSTAGRRRSMSDERNLLFYQYRAMLEALRPVGFVFENVTGLLNMDGGRVFDLVKAELRDAGYHVETWKLQAEQFGVPQRRTRVFLVGTETEAKHPVVPQPVTYWGPQPSLLDRCHPAISVEEALSDLPPLTHGEDGSHLDYAAEPANPYQMLMRGVIDAPSYLGAITVRG